jgi:hypothetical protein
MTSQSSVLSFVFLRSVLSDYQPLAALRVIEPNATRLPLEVLGCDL